MLSAGYIRLADNGIVSESIVDGIGIRYVLFTQGCYHHCDGCHNEQTHDVTGGKLVNIENILKDVYDVANYIDGVTFSGGEPFLQADKLVSIAKWVKEHYLTVWCYTGFTFEELITYGSEYTELLKYVDVLVDGKFIKDKRNLAFAFRGSSNQRIIDVQKSIETGDTVVVDYDNR